MPISHTLNRDQFYDLCLKRLLIQDVNPLLAKKAAYIQAYVDGVRRRSHHEQQLIEQLRKQIH